MREKDQLDKYYQEIRELLRGSEIDSDFAKHFLALCENGNRTFYQKNIVETKHFEEEWIRTMEAFFPSIDRIIRNPKMTIRYDEDVVAIEKAKKISSSSIRHLSSHTHLIREVRNDEVIPKKILTTMAEEEIVTYENRFIMTLIERLFIFVNNRYTIIKDNVESFEKDHLNYVSDLVVNNSNVRISFDVLIKKDLENASINKHNYDLLSRVESLVTLISGYKSSPFMKAMGKAKRVVPPIMKTNVILKNADFKNAYMLWLFLDRYNALAFDVSVRERPIRLGESFEEDLNRISLIGYAMMLENMRRRKEYRISIEEINSLVKKSTKNLRLHPEDVVNRPDAIQMFDNTINEYYLDQIRKGFDRNIKDYLKTDLTEARALKKAVKDTTTITNALFQSIFVLEESEDYFQKMTTKTNPKEDYNQAVFKKRLATVIREVKENDYKQSLKLERSLLLAMQKANTTLIKEEIRKQKQEGYQKYQKQIESELKKLNKSLEKIRSEIEVLDGKIVDVATNKTTLQLEQEQVKQQIALDKKEVAAKKRDLYKQQLDDLKKAHELKVKTLRSDAQAALARAKQEYKERVALNKARIKEAKAKVVEAEKNRRKAAIEKEKTRLNNAYQAEQKKYEDAIMAENNKINQLVNDETKQLKEYHQQLNEINKRSEENGQNEE